MTSRYDDRDYDRGEQRSGLRRESEYGRSIDRTQERYRWGREDDDRDERFAGESRWGGQYGRSRAGGEYGYPSGGYTGSRSSMGGGYGPQQRFGESSSRYSQRYNYPSDYPSRGMYGNQGERTFDYDRSRYGRGQEGGYEYERDRYGTGGEERGWLDRASDAVASWFGDEEAERRRRTDQRREEWRGKGPKGYRRSDERIREDVNDRLSEGYLDASDVEVTVMNAEVTLSGTVNSRWDKRRAEDIAESVSGVTNVENRLRVKQQGAGGYSTTTTGATSSSAAAGGTGTRTKSS